MLGWAGGMLATGATLGLSACGGGGDGDTPAEDDPSGGTPPPATGGFGDDDRFAAFASVSAKRQALRATLDDASFVQALAAYMATLPAYAETGYDTETVTAWGRMVDGRAHLIVDNRAIAPDALAAAPKPAFAAPKTELPGVSKARVLHAFGANFAGQATVRAMGAMLAEAGWSLRDGAEGDASLATLRTVSGDGFFYLNTHGGNWGHVERDLVWPINRVATHDSPRLYAVTSSTRVTRQSEADAQTKDDLANWRLVYMDADMGESDANGQRIRSELMYGITAGFVQRYWRFAPHAMAILNACSSARSDAGWSRGFYSEVLLAGVDTYLGWDRSVSATGADRTPLYAVDRLAGANGFEPESPKQRPFPVDAVMADLQRKGLDVDPGKAGARFVAVLRAGEAATHILAPTIRTVEVIETLGELHLYGGFGSDRGTVLVDQVDLGAGIVEWTPDRIRVALPASGPGSAGDVQVQVRGLKSNVRSITQWTLPLAFESANGRADTPQRVRGSGAVRFRADIGPWREQPGVAPVRPVACAVCTPDSTLTLTASGSTPGPLDCVSTWSGSIAFSGTPVVGRPVAPASITSYLKVDTASGAARLALRLGVMPGVVLHDTGCGAAEFMVNFGPLDGDDTFVVPGSAAAGAEMRLALPSVRTTVSGGYAIPAGKSGPDEFDTVTTWGAAPALPAPPLDRAV